MLLHIRLFLILEQQNAPPPLFSDVPFNHGAVQRLLCCVCGVCVMCSRGRGRSLRFVKSLPCSLFVQFSSVVLLNIYKMLGQYRL